MNTINWPIVWRIGLQGVALTVLTAATIWASGSEWMQAFRAGVLTGAGWLLGHLQKDTGGVMPDLSVLRKDKP